MMLSCGCRDMDGSGRIGDLQNMSLEEAYLGEKAQSFREQLAAGRMPTANCVRCFHLRKTSKENAKQAVERIDMPRSIMIENTSACNLRCLSCHRNRVRDLRKRRMMSLEDIKRLALDMKRMGVREASYHHLGEPFLSKQLAEELRIIRQHNPEIHIDVSTNGMMLTSDAQREAAMLFDHIQISLDGINQRMVNRYQRGSCFDTVYNNMKQLVTYRDERGLDRPVICWKYLLFRWTERRTYQLRAVELAQEAKVDELWLEPTVSPFYGVPWRTFLGANRDLGVKDGRIRYVPIREQLDAAQTSESTAV
jgi:pyruvate-formate lyase-activating enzyme